MIRLTQGCDAGQDEVDAGQELLAVVVFAQWRRQLAHERIVLGVEPRPLRGDAAEERRAVRLRGEAAGIGGVLSGGADDVADEHGPGVEPLLFGNAERQQAAAYAFGYKQHGGFERLARKPGARPWVRVDGVEQAKRNDADRLARFSAGGHAGHGSGDDVVGGRREQLVLVGDMPVDRAGPGCQAGRKRAEGERALAVAVEDIDRGLDDPFL